MAFEPSFDLSGVSPIYFGEPSLGAVVKSFAPSIEIKLPDISLAGTGISGGIKSFAPSIGIDLPSIIVSDILQKTPEDQSDFKVFKKTVILHITDRISSPLDDTFEIVTTDILFYPNPGTMFVEDNEYTASFTGVHLLGSSGTMNVLDNIYEASFMGQQEGFTLYKDGTPSFKQYQELVPGDLTLEVDKGMGIDSRYFDFSLTPISSLYYEINFIIPPDSSSKQLIGYDKRIPLTTDVGVFNANMAAPSQPGKYEIKWTYQNDSSSLPVKCFQSFKVTSRGIVPFPGYD